MLSCRLSNMQWSIISVSSAHVMVFIMTVNQETNKRFVQRNACHQLKRHNSLSLSKTLIANSSSFFFFYVVIGYIGEQNEHFHIYLFLEKLKLWKVYYYKRIHNVYTLKLTRKAQTMYDVIMMNQLDANSYLVSRLQMWHRRPSRKPVTLIHQKLFHF